jgi:hypothetical protein
MRSDEKEYPLQPRAAENSSDNEIQLGNAVSRVQRNRGRNTRMKKHETNQYILYFAQRAKGKNLFQTSITLTKEELEFLKTFPNASKLIREILDKLIAGSSSDIIVMLSQIEQLNCERRKLEQKRKVWLEYGDTYLLWVKEEIVREWDDEQYEHHTAIREVTKKDAEGYPVPLDSEKARETLNMIRAYDKEIAKFTAKICELHTKIAALGA